MALKELVPFVQVTAFDGTHHLSRYGALTLCQKRAWIGVPLDRTKIDCKTCRKFP